MTAEQSEAVDGERSSLSSHTVFVRYVVFSFVAGVANLASQQAVVLVFPPLTPLMISVLAGTAIGFAVKYVLDKHYIFLDGYDGHAAELRKVALYGVFSVATTFVFWGFELGFWYTWRSVEAKYAGAILGLAIGNWLKFLLDRAWTFGGARR